MKTIKNYRGCNYPQIMMILLLHTLFHKKAQHYRTSFTPRSSPYLILTTTAPQNFPAQSFLSSKWLQQWTLSTPATVCLTPTKLLQSFPSPPIHALLNIITIPRSCLNNLLLQRLFTHNSCHTSLPIKLSHTAAAMQVTTSRPL